MNFAANQQVELVDSADLSNSVGHGATILLVQAMSRRTFVRVAWDRPTRDPDGFYMAERFRVAGGPW